MFSLKNNLVWFFCLKMYLTENLKVNGKRELFADSFGPVYVVGGAGNGQRAVKLDMETDRFGQTPTSNL